MAFGVSDTTQYTLGDMYSVLFEGYTCHLSGFLKLQTARYAAKRTAFSNVTPKAPPPASTYVIPVLTTL
ncbi:hypothetical protein BofuT4_uP042470.1 [Botrytis cinerea T4]|uniref:Uncharacterized protein n=1 Tax=Botryotinia fuckeliana (strain T4) TaxID=999810 RepID=G2Y1U6_BOTF4|nr:hypothetical protein BofuT4_uP042470.1 [Botrytis cinerea T4]